MFLILARLVSLSVPVSCVSFRVSLIYSWRCFRCLGIIRYDALVTSVVIRSRRIEGPGVNIVIRIVCGKTHGTQGTLVDIGRTRMNVSATWAQGSSLTAISGTSAQKTGGVVRARV